MPHDRMAISEDSEPSVASCILVNMLID
jgi:hypothetical protein